MNLDRKVAVLFYNAHPRSGLLLPDNRPVTRFAHQSMVTPNWSQARTTSGEFTNLVVSRPGPTWVSVERLAVHLRAGAAGARSSLQRHGQLIDKHSFLAENRHMKKAKKWNFTHFEAETITELSRKCEELDKKFRPRMLRVRLDDARWDHDTLEEFLADYRRAPGDSHVYAAGDELDITLTTEAAKQRLPGGDYAWGWRTELEVGAKNRQTIEGLFHILEAAAESARDVPAPAPKSQQISPRIFIGHGCSVQWRLLKDHLADLHGYRVEAFETGARAGHTVRDVLEDMLNKSAFALLVLTAEDEQGDGTLRARQNVVHEAGLFQGRLGFSRAILLIEDGCEPFSNVDGIQQIRFSSQNIKETFGDVLATLRREFSR